MAEPSIRLTQYDRQMFVKAVMADVPFPTDEEIEREVQLALVKAMSPDVRRVFKTKPQALLRKHAFNLTRGRSFNFVVGDAPFEDVLKPFEDRYIALCTAQRNLFAQVENCRTVKQLVDRLPDFAKYAPRPDAPTKNLPACVGLADAFRALGWKPRGEA